MTPITFVTTNTAKFERAQRIIRPYDIDLQQYDQDLPELQAIDVATVASHKAAVAQRHVDPPFIVADTGYTIEALDGFPGALLKPVLQTIGTDGLCRLVEQHADRDATFVSVLAYVDTDGETRTFTCNDTGHIAAEPAGDRRSGWGGVMQLHIPDGFDTTLAAMDEETFSRYEAEMRQEEHYVQFAAWLDDREDAADPD